MRNALEIDMTATPIRGSIQVSRVLREIADDFDNGAFNNCGCTVIIGNSIYGLGYVHDDQAAMNTIWDCNYAIAALMRRATNEHDA